MSAIYGKLNFNEEQQSLHSLVLMQAALNHWQADDKGTWLNGAVGLGHLMLYNTPESLNEKLPFLKNDSKLAITADARIDNRDELIGKLELSHQQKNNITDSSLILAAYEKYGENCVKHLIGDFAFAIWDEGLQKLFCARDHLGVKPFFYCHNPRFFCFATEKKGILALPGIDKIINKQFFYNQALGFEQPLNTTLYQHIMRLPPAHTLSVNALNGDMKLTQYWELDAYAETKYSRVEDYYEGLLAHFTEAVECRTRSHFDVGAQLSGGMDSSAITGVAASLMRANGKELFTLANTLPGDITDPEILKHDERRFIDEVNNFNHITNKIYVTKKLFSNPLEEADFSLMINDGLERWDPMWVAPLKNAAKAHNIRTLLSGFPGDELITYRGKFFFLDYLDKRQYLKYLLVKRKYEGINKIEPLMPFWLRRGIHQMKAGLNRYDLATNARLELFNIDPAYLKHAKEFIWDDKIASEKFLSYRHFQKNRLQYPQVTHRMESETRYGLHFRTEPRFPMADIRLAQYYLAMPNELKYEGPLARTAFRKALHDFLPPAILERDNKYGSIAPFFMLYDRGSYVEVLKEVLERIPENSVIKKDVVLNRIKNNSQSTKKPGDKTYKERKYSKLPNLELLRWLEKNPGAL
ncbi:lasso peptide isopeptide bond-forming cyclase [soil metagenome]|jgi:asparagine synthase (glutamine-hydrolysing)